MSDWGFREFKKAFFDRRGIDRKVATAKRRAMSRFGAFVRTRARSSIRKRKAIAPSGEPPSSHEGSLRRLIFFALDPVTDSVVIGPVSFRAGEAPRLLEHSGRTIRRGKPAFYRGNPFMQPAGQAEVPRFPELLRNMVR